MADCPPRSLDPGSLLPPVTVLAARARWFVALLRRVPGEGDASPGAGATAPDAWIAGPGAGATAG